MVTVKVSGSGGVRLRIAGRIDRTGGAARSRGVADARSASRRGPLGRSKVPRFSVLPARGRLRGAERFARLPRPPLRTSLRSAFVTRGEEQSQAAGAFEWRSGGLPGSPAKRRRARLGSAGPPWPQDARGRAHRIPRWAGGGDRGARRVRRAHRPLPLGGGPLRAL